MRQGEVSKRMHSIRMQQKTDDRVTLTCIYLEGPLLIWVGRQAYSQTSCRRDRGTARGGSGARGAPRIAAVPRCSVATIRRQRRPASPTKRACNLSVVNVYKTNRGTSVSEEVSTNLLRVVRCQLRNRPEASQGVSTTDSENTSGVLPGK
jgi:hypothetical protein